MRNRYSMPCKLAFPKQPRRNHLASLLFGTGLALFSAGCGGGSSDTTSTSATTNTAAETRMPSILSGALPDSFAPVAVAEWSFDEGTGSTAADSSGNNYTATLAATTWATGQNAQCTVLDANSEITVDTNANSGLALTTVTIAAWVKIADPDANSFQRIISKKSVWTDADGYELEYNPAQNVLNFIGGNATVAIANNVDLDTNWHHIAVVAQGNSATLYLDGFNVSNNTYIDPLVAGSAPLRIGSDGSGASTFAGSLDTVQIFDQALNSAQVQSLAGVSITGQYTSDADGLVAQWLFDENTGTTTEDQTVNNHDGLLNNATWAPGHEGAGIQFTTNSSTVRVNNGEELAISGALSLAAWVRISDPEQNDYMRIISKKYGWDAPAGFELEYNPASNALNLLSSGNDMATAWVDLDTEWHHIVATIDGTTAHIYLDGVDVTADNSVNALVTSSEALFIGRHSLGGANFNGTLDDIRIYDKALSGEEVSKLRREHSGLIAHWSFDSVGTSSEIIDETGHGLDGTLTASASLTSGSVNQGYQGTPVYGDSMLVNTDTPELAIAGKLSLTAWIYPNSSAGDSYMRVISKKGIWDRDNGYELEYNPGLKRLTVIGSGGDTASVTIDLNDAWHHVVASVDGSSCAIYVDGILRVDDSSISPVVAGADDFAVAGNANGGDHWSGMLDEIRVYDYALTLEQALDTYADGNQPSGTARIQTPYDGAVLTANTDIALSVGAIDENDADIAATGSWSSDSLSGIFATGKQYTITDGLPVGRHELTYTVTTSQSAVLTHTVTVTIADGVLLDVSGMDHDGGLVNGATIVSDPERGDVLSFTKGAYIDSFTDGEFLNGLDEVTIGMWIKSNKTNIDQGFVKANDYNKNTKSLYMRYDKNGSNGNSKEVIKANITTTGERLKIESSIEQQTTEWQHVLMTWSSGDRIHLYINGVEDEPSYHNGSTVGVTKDATNFVIGRSVKDTTQNRGWEGLIDDVRVYSRSVSASEVTNIVSDPDTAPKPDLLHWLVVGGNG